MFTHFKLELSKVTSLLISQSLNKIKEIKLYSDKFLTDVCTIVDPIQLECPMPIFEDNDSSEIDLFLWIDGKLEETLIVPLNSSIYMFRNIKVTGSETFEPSTIIESIDSFVQVLGTGFIATSLPWLFSPPVCMFIDGLVSF